MVGWYDTKLIKYLSSQKGITFVTLVDTKNNGLLLKTNSKGRPTKEQVLERELNVSSYAMIRDELQLDGTPNILVACAW